MNIERKKGFTQVCVWPGTIVGEEKISEFTDWMKEEFNVNVQYLEEIKTNQDVDEFGNPIAGTGDRNDVFFAVKNEDVEKFAIPRLKMGIRWIEDVLSSTNYKSAIYPSRVYDYKSWEA